MKGRTFILYGYYHTILIFACFRIWSFFNETNSTNTSKIGPKPNKNQPYIGSTNNYKNESKFYPKMTPKWTPNGSQNRPKIDPGTTLGSEMCQRWSKRVPNHRFWWLFVDFGSIFNRFRHPVWSILSIPGATDFGTKQQKNPDFGHIRRNIRIDHDRRTLFSLFGMAGFAKRLQ